MYVYHNLDDNYWNITFNSVAQDTGLYNLAVTTTRMCQIYLGLPKNITWCQEANDKTCSEFMNCLLLSGNFGYKNGDGNTIERISTSMKREGFFKWLQFTGMYNWKAYHKHHWLKPFCWLYQLFRYFVQGGRISKQLIGDLDRSTERFKLLKKLGIS